MVTNMDADAQVPALYVQEVDRAAAAAEDPHLLVSCWPYYPCYSNLVAQCLPTPWPELAAQLPLPNTPTSWSVAGHWHLSSGAQGGACNPMCSAASAYQPPCPPF
jgi:hypothetical protein